MSRHTYFSCSALVCAAVSALVAVERPAAAQAPPQPTEHHKILLKDVGTWDVDYKMWMAPDMAPMSFEGVEKNRMLFGGLWMISEFTSEAGDFKFEGHGVFGYDPAKKKYVGTWVDNMNPEISPMEGTYDADTKTLTTFSQGRNPSTGKMEKNKSVSRYIDDDTRISEMYLPGEDGQMWKMMEFNHKRRK